MYVISCTTHLIIILSRNQAADRNDLILRRSHRRRTTPDQAQRVLRRAEGGHLPWTVARIENQQLRTVGALLDTNDGARMACASGKNCVTSRCSLSRTKTRTMMLTLMLQIQRRRVHGRIFEVALHPAKQVRMPAVR